jgi:hypothetical protein
MLFQRLIAHLQCAPFCSVDGEPHGERFFNTRPQATPLSTRAATALKWPSALNTRRLLGRSSRLLCAGIDCGDCPRRC